MRITRKDLEAVVDRLNMRHFGTKESVTWPDGKFNSQEGMFTVSGAYGGFSLHQYANEAGAVHDVFSCGHIKARDLYNRMQAALSMTWAVERIEALKADKEG